MLTPAHIADAAARRLLELGLLGVRVDADRLVTGFARSSPRSDSVHFELIFLGVPCALSLHLLAAQDLEVRRRDIDEILLAAVALRDGGRVVVVSDLILASADVVAEATLPPTARASSSVAAYLHRVFERFWDSGVVPELAARARSSS